MAAYKQRKTQLLYEEKTSVEPGAVPPTSEGGWCVKTKTFGQFSDYRAFKRLFKGENTWRFSREQPAQLVADTFALALENGFIGKDNWVFFFKDLPDWKRLAKDFQSEKMSGCWLSERVLRAFSHVGADGPIANYAMLGERLAGMDFKGIAKSIEKPVARPVFEAAVSKSTAKKVSVKKPTAKKVTKK